ncbi:putative cysteine-rich receptor-like protein kinase 9 isoform X2 [Macadamia integrifolia]|uniref:putative cysteine-rich receptor-like protein kinase 9 isoform X2 n=1 Tax=Macadamia integrifolia TaxID=60698 RepID=UPI001C4ECEA1|nr:putative cysteine-rich receptor-like protein kinase 9 isoform X2 [Macadamia integrifolia]
MAYTPLFMIFISCMLFLLQLLPTITAEYIASNCTYNSSVTNSITYLANLDSLLLCLSSNANATSGTGFYNDTAGNGSDKVYGLYLCRGDLTLEECQTCVKKASVEIKSNCPNTTAAVTWYDDCMLRYTNVSFFSTLQQEPFRYGAAPNDVTKVDQYNQTVGELMNGLMNQAVDGSTSTTPKYYAAGAVTYYTKIDTVYGLVQCTPDITQDDCKNCLTGSISIDLLRLIYPKRGGKILKPSCNIRFEFNYPFYHDKVTSTVTDGERRNSREVIIVIIVVVVIVATFITIIIISNLYLRVRRKKQKQKQKLRVEDEDDQIEISSVDPIQFNFDTIRSATNNFSDANKLGQGGFGAVYKILLNAQNWFGKNVTKSLKGLLVGFFIFMKIHD